MNPPAHGLFGFAACLLGASCGLAVDEPASGKVVDVYDGDSITVESDGARHKCRLLGIDAPEMSYARLWTEMDKVSKYTPPGASDDFRAAREAFRQWAKVMEEHAGEARNALEGLVMDKTVRLAYNAKGRRKDRYGRLLIYVSTGDVDVNAELVRRGLAIADTRFSCDRLKEYVRLWRVAQAAGVGLWSAHAKEGERKQSAEEEPSPTRSPSRDRDGGGRDPTENEESERGDSEERRVGLEDP